MKIWHCSYDWHGGWGAYQTYEIVCVAETKERAIELAMKSAGEFGSNKNDWSAEEMFNNINEESAYYVSSRCS